MCGILLKKTLKIHVFSKIGQALFKQLMKSLVNHIYLLAIMAGIIIDCYVY